MNVLYLQSLLECLALSLKNSVVSCLNVKYFRTHQHTFFIHSFNQQALYIFCIAGMMGKQL